MFVSIIKHDALTTPPGKGAPGVPQGIVKHDTGPRRHTQLDCAGKCVEALELFRIRIEIGFVRPRNNGEVALVGDGHVREEIANLQLQKRNMRPQGTVTTVVTIDVPARFAFFGFGLPERVRGMKMGIFVQ